MLRNVVIIAFYITLPCLMLINIAPYAFKDHILSQVDITVKEFYREDGRAVSFDDRPRSLARILAREVARGMQWEMEDREDRYLVQVEITNKSPFNLKLVEARYSLRVEDLVFAEGHFTRSQPLDIPTSQTTAWLPLSFPVPVEDLRQPLAGHTRAMAEGKAWFLLGDYKVGVPFSLAFASPHFR